MQGLPAGRVLASHGVPVIGVVADRSHSQSRTNICQEMICAPTAEPELIPSLVELGKRLPHKAVLFPCEDTNVKLISEYRDQLEPWFHVLLPDADTVDLLMDKVRFYQFADEQGLPIPKTAFIRNEQDLAHAIQDFEFPCVFKPHDSAARKWESETIFKAFKVHSASELESTYQHYKKWTDCFILQEWIEGKDADLYSCNCYYDRSGKPLATFVAKKLRQWPPETGVSSLGQEVRDDTVLQETLNLFGSVNYHGLGYLEMKRDRRTGKYFIVEPNIGRPTGRSTIAEAGNVALLYTAYCDALGLPLPENREQTYQGVKWIHFRKDLQSALQYWRRGELTLWQWLQSIRGKKRYAVASWRDPWPFIYDFLGAVRSVMSRNYRRKRTTVEAQSDD